MTRQIPVTLLGFTVPEADMQELLARDMGMPIQTHKFAWNLVRSLSDGGCRVTLVSAMPASNFPANKSLRFRKKRFRAEGVDGVLIGFVNVLILKHVTRLLSCLATGTKAMSAWKPDVLLVHGVHTPYLWYAVLLRRIKGTAVIPVLTDPPGVVLPSEGKLKALLKRIDIWCVKQALRCADGVIALTESLARDFAPGIPYLVVEGIAAPVAPQSTLTPRPADEPFRIVYAGGLTAAYGVDRLVHAVRQLRTPGLRLDIYGRGELSSWIAEQAAQDERITPPRFMDSESLQAELAKADVLFNPRPVDQEFVKYSFPSKLIEYLASGTMVVTTKLPGIPPEYDDKLVYAETDTPAGFANVIENVMRMGPTERQILSEAATRFIRETRSHSSQGRKMAHFLSHIVATRS